MLPLFSKFCLGQRKFPLKIYKKYKFPQRNQYERSKVWEVFTTKTGKYKSREKFKAMNVEGSYTHQKAISNEFPCFW